MDITSGNARELIALRAALNEALTYDEIRLVNWSVIGKEAGPAIARGWTGTELAAWAVGELSETTQNAAAVIVSVLRDLAGIDPPRPPATPQPPPVADVLADIHTRHTPGDAQQWINRIRAQHEQRKRDSA